MKGFPLQNLIFMVLALAALAIPLLRVNRPAPPAPADAATAGLAPAPKATAVLLRLRFVQPPVTVALTVDGKPVPLRGDGLERGGETTLTSDRGNALELHLQAAWPPGPASTMVEVRAAPDGKPEQVQNVWAEAGAADELLRFTWRDRP